MSKRLFSYLSWRRSRRRIHRPEILDLVVQDVRAQGPEHLIVTGDLVNLALPDEFEQAQGWLERQGRPDRLTVVPGNHDALVPVGWAEGLGRWSAWMGGTTAADAFPFVKRVGEAALIGLSAAVPTAPFLATGRLGDVQLLRLARTLALLGQEGVFRVVLVHHPVTDGAVSARKALEDRAALRQVLAEYGAELVLHGHSHHATTETILGPAGEIPVVGAPSASAAPGAYPVPAGWRMVRIEPANDAWQVELVGRAMRADGGFDEVDRQSFRIERPSPGAPAFQAPAP